MSLKLSYWLFYFSDGLKRKFNNIRLYRLFKSNIRTLNVINIIKTNDNWCIKSLFFNFGVKKKLTCERLSFKTQLNTELLWPYSAWSVWKYSWLIMLMNSGFLLSFNIFIREVSRTLSVLDVSKGFEYPSDYIPSSLNIFDFYGSQDLMVKLIYDHH